MSHYHANKLPILKRSPDLDLADSSRVGDELEVDALIGSNNYWQLVTGQVIQGQSGPTAINTYLGWVLSDPVSGNVGLCNQTPITQCSFNHQMHHHLH